MMLRLKGKPAWLLSLFALLLLHSKCLASTAQETDRPNLESAMVGFDPFLANAYEQFDPGFKKTLFENTGKVFDSKFNTYSFPNGLSNYFTCVLQFTNTVLTNFSHYKSEKENRFFITQDENDDKNQALNEVNVRDVSSGGLEETMDEKIIREFFSETNGEIVQSKIACIALELSVPPFSRPIFTADFSAALQTLQLAAKNSDPEHSKKVYRKFIDTYGTHYMKNSKMGAEIIFQKLFTEKEMDDKTKYARNNCIYSLAKRVVANGATSVEAVVDEFSETSETCVYSSGGEEYFTGSGINSSRVIINGPPLIGTMEQWNTAVKRSPVPIYFELEKISSLFLRNRIESSLSTGDGTNLCEATNGISLYKLLESEYSTYCQEMAGNLCSPEIGSFDANIGCPPGHTCSKVSDTSDAHKCTTPYDIGGVIITGGWNRSLFSDVETINTWQLPDLPDAITDHTLSQVGAKVHNCGGNNNGKVTDECYTLDLSSRSPVWQLSLKMPKPMRRHAAVTIGSHIWLTNNNELYDLTTEEQLFRTYRLPMVVSDYHCAVSNNTHSYIIGAGSTKTEIWVNKYSSRPAEWLLVAHLHSERFRQGCLWFKDNVFIAGGVRGGKVINDVELLNTATNTVTVTGPLLHNRETHRMFVLDGEPAVVGGYDGTAGGYWDTIEIFNTSSSSWRASDRKLLAAKGWFGLVQLH